MTCTHATLHTHSGMPALCGLCSALGCAIRDYGICRVASRSRRDVRAKSGACSDSDPDRRQDDCAANALL